MIWENPLVEQLDFYISDSTNHRFSHTQQKILTYQKDKNRLIRNQNLSWVRSKLKRCISNLPANAGITATCYKTQADDYSGQGFFNGLVIFCLFPMISLSLFMIIDLPFRLYSLNTVIKTFAFWGYLNVAGPLFTNNPDVAKKIDFLFYNYITMGSGLFILFTPALHKLPKQHSILIVCIPAFTAFDGIIVFFDYQWYWLKAGLYTIVFSAIYFIILYTIVCNGFGKKQKALTWVYQTPNNAFYGKQNSRECDISKNAKGRQMTTSIYDSSYTPIYEYQRSN